ncbi:hypothetical protein Poli38472_003741 [Pythium oligandrum]|uniref:Uncharacterized protein n=1 Tax=Pythium oligandrum TaxID=41045 RepID=A0A8K1CLS6_PYTOL|nr:hypothetical protein Poli38472_003741 [Pythium oligandrum]|eukprot:TMW65976.1 hypothetical protein Poli38472_003741 [Pythium oligandrum]
MSVVPRSTSPPPATLFELLANVWGVIDYHKIRVSVIRIGSKPIVEYEQEAWRLQLFTAIYRLTPIDWKTSIDRGELFGGPGFIDLVIHNREASARWGIAMVYSRDDLREHVARFRPGGRYAALGLTDFCVLCFQHVTEEELEKDSLAQTDLASDLDVHPMVFVICYDVNVTSVLVWNAKGEKALRVENPAFNRGPVMYRGFSHP